MLKRQLCRSLIRITALLLGFVLVSNIVNAVEPAPLRFGVAAMISPEETINIYRHLLVYLSQKIGRPVKMVQRKTYAEMDELLKSKNVEIAMICSGPYVADHDEFGAELLVAAQMYGKAFYHSYLIVSRESEMSKLDDLKGKTFAFTDPRSNTGCIVPTYMLAKINETPDTFFSNYQYSGHHSRSIELVASGLVDGTSVDNLIWEYLNNTDRQLTSLTKVVAKSPPYGIPPVVVHPTIDPVLKEQIKQIFLDMHKDPIGEGILASIFIDKFVVPKDSNYDSVREMIAWIENNSVPGPGEGK